ncbi:MAG TPA: NAD-dependent epimerase/dehydratase family protein [Candidatus Nanoarchaeia archaeon]|nr:UDP-glucose 4-epimerase [uncultured archaeon]
MRIIVTGGAGFLGAHIHRVLLDESYEVKVIDNLSRGFRDNVDPRASFEQLDLADQDKITKALEGYEAVIHLANYLVVPESVEKPVEYAENNVVNTVKLMEAMKDAGVKKIVFSSSATVYGDNKNLPLTEDTPLGVQANQYGASKIAMEAFISTYHSLYNFDVTHLRYFNPYGPFEKHAPETHAIPNFIKAALKKEEIPLYWKGEQIRDFIYAQDLAEAHTSVLDLKGLNIFNVGSETGIKVIDVVKLIFDIVGYEVPTRDLGKRVGDVPANYASSKKLTQTTGWKAKTSLREGLVKTIEYFRENLT